MPKYLKLILPILFTVLISLSNNLSAQEKTNKLYSNSIAEYVHDYNTNKYELVFNTGTVSEFVFVGDTIYFRKYQAGMWLTKVLTLDIDIKRSNNYGCRL